MKGLKKTLEIRKRPKIKMIKIAVDLKYPCGLGQCFGSAIVSLRIRVRIQAFIDQPVK
jgi:hypothetical protein